MVTEKILNMFKEDDEEYLILLMSHEKLTVGFAHRESFDPLFEPPMGKAVKRLKINRIDGGTQIVNINPNKLHFGLPLFDIDGRVKGKHAVIYLHDIDGVEFGVAADTAKGESIVLLPIEIQQKIKNLEIELHKTNLSNLSFTEALNILPNQARFAIEQEQRAILDKKLRGLYQPPFLPKFGDEK